jgi:hypothetical protein
MKRLEFRLALFIVLFVPFATAQQNAHTPLPATTAPAYPPVDVTGQSTAGLPPDADMNGHYDCTGAFGNKRIHRSTFEMHTPLASTWLELDERDIEPATNYQAKYLIGYDASTHHMIEFDANNFGAAVYTSESGWVKGQLIMTSPLSTDPKAPYIANRFVYTILSADSFSVDWQITRAQPNVWLPADHLLCKRSSAPSPDNSIR